MVCKDWCSHKILERKSPSISFPNKMYWLIMTWDKRCYGCRYGILDHFGPCFRYGILSFCQLQPAFSLVADRLGGQVSEQKDRGTLDKVKMPKKVADNMQVRLNIPYTKVWRSKSKQRLPWLGHIPKFQNLMDLSKETFKPYKTIVCPKLEASLPCGLSMHKIKMLYQRAT